MSHPAAARRLARFVAELTLAATGETGSGGQREAPTTQETTTQETLDPAARIPAAGIAMVDEGPT